ncbi:DEAD/DEAH box helicase [Clostridium intestinale]|uniref:Superfamily II DNA and RNA helicase n=1 Tax=Clostridium intestinale DSM 6191 TaxID=1121320 RepID=A0A1M6DQ55_9CLOT|nr:DEAD/DEAH box helicase [Clostridium intestinale]SHI75293.1 Superfamily II DNA and RNA helicase [Clostridium intestinale DSM 6191]
MSITFDKLNLNKDMVEALKNLKITEATEVQEKSIPLALEGKNILAQSETGTGKTLAYLLPLIEKLQKDKKEMQAIILAPTYELCMQIHNTILELKKESNGSITSTQLIGSANIARQIEKLKDKPNILVGSSGRVLELIRKKKITASTIKTIVLDEVDKLLDNKNIPLIKDIVKNTQKVDQFLMFSATINNSSLQLSKELVEDLEVIRVKGSNKVNEDITHNYIMVEERKKVEYLRKLIHAARPKRAIVFISNSFNVDQTLEKLKFHKINAATIHGDIDKDERKNALESFRKGKIQVLVASDVAARGLDIKGVTHVINLDTPRDPKNYLHRVGRVGRAGEKGEAYSLVDNRDLNNIRVYEKDLNLKFNRKYVYMGKVLQD